MDCHHKRMIPPKSGLHKLAAKIEARMAAWKKYQVEMETENRNNVNNPFYDCNCAGWLIDELNWVLSEIRKIEVKK